MLLKIVQICLPEFVMLKKMKDLFGLTADAFQCKVPELNGLSYDECLIKYALFTKEQSEKSILSGQCLDELKSRLYYNSCIYGQKLRKILHVKNRKDAVKALQTVYKLICKLISSLDEGLASGLTDGGKLCFMHRITEGNSCCEGFLCCQK